MPRDSRGGAALTADAPIGRPRARLRMLVAVAAAGHVLLAAGLFAPAITIQPRMGKFTAVARVLRVLEPDETLSIITSTLRLMQRGEVAIGLVILLASVVMPILKLVVINRALADAWRGRPITPWLARLAHVTKYSLIDVLVVGILIVCAKAFPGGTTITARWGLACFAVAAVLPWIVVLGLRRPASQKPRDTSSPLVRA